MRYRVIVAASASEDEEELLAYLLARDEIVAAVALEARFDRALRSLETFPLRGRVVPELRRHGVISYRELIVAPHRVMYRIDARTVRVVAIVDGRRDLDDILVARIRRTP